MTWIKICGMTNLEDALCAVEAGADAVGFVFYGKSPRNVSIETAREIVKELPEAVEKVGIFVDANCEQMSETVSEAGLTVAQLHGGYSLESVWRDSRPVKACLGVSKVIPMMHGDDLQNGIVMGQRVTESFAVLVDSRLDGLEGGTGTTFNWEKTRGMVQAMSLTVPVIVAGGMTPVNVRAAINVFQPFGVDVVSGVEAKPGKKDPEKVRAFVRAVREIDARVG